MPKHNMNTTKSKITITTFTSNEGIKGLSIEIDGRGADFYADGSYSAWDGEGAFNRCEATNRLTPYVSRNALKEGIAAAEKEFGVAFDIASIGIGLQFEISEDGH